MKKRRALLDQRGATLLEYVLIGVVVLVVVAAGYKALGKKTAHQAADDSNLAFTDEGAESARSGSGTSGRGKSSIAMKMSVGHSQGASFVEDSTSRDASDVGFSFKKVVRWFAIAILALGMGVGYSVFKRARAEAVTADKGPM